MAFASSVALVEPIEEVAPNSKVDFFYGDLSIMDDVKKIGHDINEKYPKIDVLINNVGLHGFEQRITPDGFSEMIAVNYFAPWLLTNILLNSLKNAKEARIVNVASEASRNNDSLILPDDLTDVSPFTSKESSIIYGKTKLLNIMFSNKLSRSLEGTSVVSNALNPGFNNTGLGGELKISHVLGRILKLLNIGNPKHGANIITKLALEEDYKNVSGNYVNVKTFNLIEGVYPSNDIKMQDCLWEVTSEILCSYL